MGRQKIIQDDNLLRIARETFIEKGVGAPASEIARRAGISEAAIFKRYPTKSELFFAALGFPEFDIALIFDEAAKIVETTAQLEFILLKFLEYLNGAIPILATLISHPSFNPADFSSKLSDAPLNSMTRRLTAFFEEKKRSGLIADCEPFAVAGVIYSSLHSFAMFEHMGVHNETGMSNKMRVHLLVKVIWDGIKPTEKQTGKRGKRK